MNLNEFVDGKYFEIKADNGLIMIYRDGLEYHKHNEELNCVECWSKLNFVEPEAWVEYYPLAVNLYESLITLTESDLMIWLTDFKSRSEYEIL